MAGSNCACLCGCHSGNRYLPFFISAGVFAAGVALCIAFESSSAHPSESRVLHQESVITPTEVEPLADCNRSERLAASPAAQCEVND